MKILLLKETRPGELRVALIPDDVKKLVDAGHRICVESNAGVGAGFTDEDYKFAGASIKNNLEISPKSVKSLFNNIDMIVRVKRPPREQEILENKFIPPGTHMVGTLDPLERNSPHMQEYADAKIVVHSIDQLALSEDDPMNLLASMSKIAGRMALQDALKNFNGENKKVLIIGFGVAGRAAFEEANKIHLPTTVIITKEKDAEKIIAAHGIPKIMDKTLSLADQQKFVKEIVKDVNIIITSARKSNALAPLLIPATTLAEMQPGSVIVDLALPEGGNVEGCPRDDKTILGNQITVINDTYPKSEPKEASFYWSRATRLYIEQLT